MNTVPRGWAMRRGHLKNMMRPKTGKAAVKAEIQGQGREVFRGRSVFKRSVNIGCRYKCQQKESKSRQRSDLQCQVARDWCVYEEESLYWGSMDDYYYEEEDAEEWAPDVCSVKMPCKDKEKPSKMGDVEKLAGQLQRVHAFLDTDLLNKRSKFSCLQFRFLKQHGTSFCQKLVGCMSGSINVKPSPVSKVVQERFLNARCLGGFVRPAYHGTNVANLPTIYENGLLIPGQDNNLKVVNGSAHGLGIYTANEDSPSLSWGYCRAPSDNEKRMMVCGVLDDALIPESESVRKVGNAMVVFDHRRVAPLFEVSLRAAQQGIQTPGTVEFDWSRWRIKVSHVLDATPEEKPLRRRRLQHTSDSRAKTAKAYLARRGARKRNPKGI